MILSYFLGQRYYPVPYNILKGMGYLLLAIAIWFISTLYRPGSFPVSILYHTFLLLLFLVPVYFIERPQLLRER
jgi:hypothetical protein